MMEHKDQQWVDNKDRTNQQMGTKKEEHNKFTV
jgi:hypothetical protein